MHAVLIIGYGLANFTAMQSSLERETFSARLRGRLNYSGYPDNSPTWLAREFNRRYAGNPVSSHGVRKWLQGDSIPSQDKLRVLASWLAVSPEWLRYGAAVEVEPVLPSVSPPPNRVAEPLLDYGLMQRIAALTPAHRLFIDEMVAALQRLEQQDVQ
jgi:hypothetical protein